MKRLKDKTDSERRSWLSRVSVGLLFCSAAIAFTGCATVKIPNDRSPAPSTGLTGNWQFQVSPTGGSAPFTSLAGFINETEGNSTDGDPVTAILQAATPSNCFLGTTIIPLQGTVKTDDLNLRSFSIVGQFLTLTATEDSTFTHLTGTYSVGGSCPNGEGAGTISGTRYASLTGTYAGSITNSNPPKTLSLSLTQSPDGQGDGSFLVTGTAAFNGISCFTRGTVTGPDSHIIGESVSLTLTTDTPNTQLLLSGTIDSAAHTLSLTSMQVNGTSCSGLGPASLTRSP